MSANSRLTVAVHALCMLELAGRRGMPALRSERLAASLDANPVLVRRVLGPLRDGGLLDTARGPGGGWALARPAEEISVEDVRVALGSPPSFALHASEPNLECPVGFGIRPVLADVYADADRALGDVLRRQTIAATLDRLLAEHPLPAGERA